MKRSSLRPSPIARARDLERRQARRFTRRVVLLAGAQLAVAGTLAARLHRLQAENGERYRLLAEKNRIDLRLVVPPRGRILDRNGRPLAENRSRYELVALPGQVGDPAAVLASAGRILGWERGEAARFEESLARHPPFLPFVLHRDLTWEEVSALELRTPELAGLQVVSAVARHYPLGPALGHLLGYVSAPDESDQRRYPQIRRMPGARVGRAGLEARFEPALQGRPGARQLEVDAAGRRVRELSYERGEAGEDIVASVDAGMQSYVWRRLQSERSAAAAVLDLSSGDTLALCSTPAADPRPL